MTPRGEQGLAKTDTGIAWGGRGKDRSRVAHTRSRRVKVKLIQVEASVRSCLVEEKKAGPVCEKIG